MINNIMTLAGKRNVTRLRNREGITKLTKLFKILEATI